MTALAVSCTSHSYPTATIACCRDDIFDASQVLSALRDKCPAATGRVNLHFTISGIRRRYSCSVIRGNATRAENELVASVADRNHAAARAERALQTWRSLRVDAHLSRSTLEWEFAITTSDYRCEHFADVAFQRDSIAEARQSGENATHWLQIEAGRAAGACPERLPTLFRGVSSAGQPNAVAFVRSQLAAVPT